MAEPPLSPRLQAVAAPISADAPTGRDVRYEDAYQQLKAEVDNFQSASADADFGRIVALATEILTGVSKDLTAAVFLALGLQRTDGLSGVAEGAEAVRILCDTYWDDLFPPLRRMAARKNALQLLADRIFDGVKPAKPGPKDGPALEAAVASYNALQTLVTEQMGDDAPLLSKLIRLLEDKRRAVPDPAKPKEEAPPKPAGPAPAGAPAAAGSAAAGPPAELATPLQADAAVLAAAAFLLAADRTNAVPYRLARTVRWAPIQAAPPAGDGGKTRLEGYIPVRAQFLADLAASNQHAALLEGAEDSFLDYPLWLDLQRYVATSMAGLGAAYAAAREVVITDLALLLQRAPTLPTLTFSNGTALADAETREWIDAEVLSALGGGESAGVETAVAGASEALTKQYETAIPLAGTDLPAALETMQEGAGADRAAQDRFRRRLYAARLCLRGRKPALARPIFEELGAEATQRRLEEWDPALVVDVWAGLHEACRLLADRAEGEEAQALRARAEQAFGAVCAVDPRKALSLSV